MRIGLFGLAASVILPLAMLPAAAQAPAPPGAMPSPPTPNMPTSPEALQKSMLAMITNAQHPNWADPKYWAPFVVVAEPAKPAN